MNPCPDPWANTTFIGGSQDGIHCELQHTPRQIQFETVTPAAYRNYDNDPTAPLVTTYEIYERLDDPATGEYLGGYMYVRTYTTQGT